MIVSFQAFWRLLCQHPWLVCCISINFTRYYIRQHLFRPVANFKQVSYTLLYCLLSVERFFKSKKKDKSV